MFKQVLFLLLALCIFSGCKEEIARDLEDHQLRKIVSALADAGVEPERTRQANNRWTLSVDRDEVLRAMQLIDQLRLVEHETVVPAESSLFMTEEEQRLKYEQQVAHKIETTLKCLDGVLDAKVLMNLPVADSLHIKKSDVRGSGSVLIIGTVDLLVSPEEVQQLVAGASGLAPTDIHVLVKSGRLPDVPLTEAAKISPASHTGWIAGSLVLIIGSLIFLSRVIVKKKGVRCEHNLAI